MTAEPRTSDQPRTPIAETTVRVLAEMVGRQPATLTDDTKIFMGLGLGSANALELLMLLEDELGLDLTASALDWRHLETVGALTRYVEERAAG